MAEELKNQDVANDKEQNPPQDPAEKQDEGGEGAEKKLKYGAPRDAAMADLIRRRQEKVATEITPHSEPDDKPLPTPATETPAKPDELVDIRVFPEDADGFVGKVKQSEIDAAGGREAYGKRIAADIILQRQKEALKRAKEEEARIQKERAELEELRQKSKAPDQATTHSADDLTEEEKTEVQHYLDEYGEDVAKLAERAIRAMKRPVAAAPQLDISAISKEAAEKAVSEINEREYQKRLREADKAFSDKFGHLESEPRLRQISIEEFSRIVRESPNMDPVDAALQAGRAVEDWLVSQGVVRKDPAMAAKEQAKRSTTAAPVPAGARMPAAPEVRPPTPSDVIRTMRVARGLPT
jgi:hypothetical protein